MAYPKTKKIMNEIVADFNSSAYGCSSTSLVYA